MVQAEHQRRQEEEPVGRVAKRIADRFSFVSASPASEPEAVAFRSGHKLAKSRAAPFIAAYLPCLAQ